MIWKLQLMGRASTHSDGNSYNSREILNENTTWLSKYHTLTCKELQIYYYSFFLTKLSFIHAEWRDDRGSRDLILFGHFVKYVECIYEVSVLGVHYN